MVLYAAIGVCVSSIILTIINIIMLKEKFPWLLKSFLIPAACVGGLLILLSATSDNSWAVHVIAYSIVTIFLMINLFIQGIKFGMISSKSRAVQDGSANIKNKKRKRLLKRIMLAVLSFVPFSSVYLLINYQIGRASYEDQFTWFLGESAVVFTAIIIMIMFVRKWED